MSLLPYPSYRNSGIDALDGVPAHWDVFPLKRELEFLTSGSRGWSELYSDDGPLFIRIGNLTRDSVYLDLSDIQRVDLPDGVEGERTRVRPGDLLFSITAYLGSVAVVPEDIESAYVSQHVALARLCNRRLKPLWVAYATLSSVGETYFGSQAYGGTKIQLSLDDVAGLPLPVPPLAEQVVIAAFLDRETARIDTLVAEQGKLIELLNEKRQAVISHAVTKGINPNASMRDSGIRWLGEVPAHWDVVPLKHVISRIESGTSVNALDAPADEGQVGVLKTSCVYAGDFSIEENKAVFPEEYDRVSCPLRRDTLIVSRMNTPDLVGAAGLVRESRDGIYLPDRLWQVSLLDAEPTYAHYWTRTQFYRAQVQVACSGTSSSMQNLSQPQFGSFLFPKPPCSEQRQIAMWLDKETARFADLISEAQRAVELLKEHRSALISAAVTGKIDVRGLASGQTNQEALERA